jgi:hypothetical protein
MGGPPIKMFNFLGDPNLYTCSGNPTQRVQSPNFVCDIGVDEEQWLVTAIDRQRKVEANHLSLPLCPDGTLFDLERLYPDQLIMVYFILECLQDWFTCNDLSKFIPGLFLLMGQGGTGKSVILNTSTTVVRRKFCYKNTVGDTGPTGSSAFNVFGMTLH